MQTKIGFTETIISSDQDSLQIAATIQHKTDKGTESIAISIRLPGGDRSLTGLQSEILARVRLLLEAVDDSIPPGSQDKLDVWRKLAE